MITKNIKISKMLNDYPETLEVMLEASPHFSKLKNSFLRKTLGSRVTVEQAAAIAGVSLEDLLTKLNKKINMENDFNCSHHNQYASLPREENVKPEFFNSLPEEKFVPLDVRDEIKSGVDPFFKIKDAVSKLKEDEVLHLINVFEPVPLYHVLGKKGFKHYTELIDSVWHIYFYKEENKDADIQDDNSAAGELPDELIEIDVRELSPPEPMMKILNTLPQLGENGVLVVHHHREPAMLYEKLEERGFMAVTNKIEENYYKVVITRKG
jgi:uncharacterized protein (DUF2249 family)